MHDLARRGERAFVHVQLDRHVRALGHLIASLNGHSFDGNVQQAQHSVLGIAVFDEGNPDDASDGPSDASLVSQGLHV